MDEISLNKLLLDVKTEALERGYGIVLPTMGKSMFPFITSSDKIHVIRCDVERLRYGDIILSKADSSNGIMAHRLIWRRKVKDGFKFITKGDFHFYCDKPVHSSLVIGKIIKIEKPHFSLSLRGLVGRILSLFMLGVSVTRIYPIVFKSLGKIVTVLKFKRSK